MFYYFNAEKKFYENPAPTIKPWATATDAEIADMLTAHYNGLIDLSTEEGWEVGSKRSIALSAMSATGVSESHHADSYDFVIIGHKHDDLTTPINGVTKAAITVQLDRILFTDTTTEYNSSMDAAHEYGYMNDTATNVGGWTSCARRTWCNSVFFGALPSSIQNLVKNVDKNTSDGNQSSTINTDSDKVFLPSEIEVFGTNTYSFSGEGTQYQYFTDATSNRYKKPIYNSSRASGAWWERSPYSNSSSWFCIVGVVGSGSGDIASSTLGLAPAFCL